MTGRLVPRAAAHVPLVTGFSFVSLEGITSRREAGVGMPNALR